MILGDKCSFAIEFNQDPNNGKEWLFGKFCYWINGTSLGDYELGTSLRDVLFQMRGVVADCGNREADWCKCGAKDIYDLLDGAIYNDAECDVDMPARYDISISVDVFDGIKIYLIDCVNSDSRIIYSIDDGITVIDTRIASGKFDSIVNSCYTELNKIYEESIR